MDDEAVVEFYEELIHEEYEEYRKRVKPYLEALHEVHERVDAKLNRNQNNDE